MTDMIVQAISPAYDIDRIYRGRGKTLTLSIEDENGDPMDLTGFSAQAQLRAEADPTSTLLATATMTVDADPTTGKLYLSMNKTVTAAIPAAEYGYIDITLIDSTNPNYPYPILIEKWFIHNLGTVLT